jgi:hypothetical protein
MKYDVSDRSHDQAPSPIGAIDRNLIPLQTLKKERSNTLASAAQFYQSAALVAACYDDPTLVAQCSPGEKNAAIARATGARSPLSVTT